MRASGACALQQTLTTEAASVLKHSLSLARRRGHSQVTPLHVAATLLLSPRPPPPLSSLFNRAIMNSLKTHHQFPLQSRALELCFNVALNRLPTTTSPLLHAQPSLSNALIAALKRAQAHQRRGCLENQHQTQPILAIKIELDQLILSILDDPSVSRVMREAGFSSTSVKKNLEEYSSSSANSVFSQCYNYSCTPGGGGVYSSPSSPSRPETTPHSNFWQTHFWNYNSDQNPPLFSPQKTNPLSHSSSVKEDVKLVFEVFSRQIKRRNTVIVGDSESITECIVAEVMDRVEKGDVPCELKSAHFVKFQFSSVPLGLMKREDVERNISDLKRKVDSLSSGGERVIIYAGDLKWTVGEGEVSGYDPVDHLVADIGRLISDYSNSSTKKEVWLLATANYQTYMRCQMRQPSLDIQWSLQAVSVPSGGLGLSLHANSVHDSRVNFSQNPSQVLDTKPFFGKEEQDQLTCCEECTSKYEKEAGLIKSGGTRNADEGSTHLPYWLQSQATEMQKDDFIELRRKWNRLCHIQHHENLSEKSYIYTSSSPWWAAQNSKFRDSNSLSFSHSASKPNHSSVPRFRRQNSCHIEFSFSSNGDHKNKPVEPNLDSLKNTEGKEEKISLSLGNSNSQLFDSGKLVERKSEICRQLQENVPWQLETIPSIVEALVESKPAKKETWLLIEGNDSIGKRRLARGIAESVFGSAGMLIHMNLRGSQGKMSPGTMEKAFRDHEKLVVLVENADFADSKFLKFLAEGFETGKFGELSKKDGNYGQAIFILTKGDSSTSCGNGMDLNSVTQIKLEIRETIPNFDKKRKAEWDLPNKAKSLKIEEKENANPIAGENGNTQKEFTRQSSSNNLDLNIRADEDDNENEAKEGDFSPTSSDLSHEMGNDLNNSLGFLELIKNRFVFNQDSTQDESVF